MDFKEAAPDNVEQWTAAILNLLVSIVTFVKWLKAKRQLTAARELTDATIVKGFGWDKDNGPENGKP